MSKPSMSDEEYKERKNNLLKNSMGNENQFLEYVLFCVVSDRRYTTNNLVTDLSDARLEIKDVIDVYNESSSNSVYFDFLKRDVPLTFLKDTLSPLLILYKRGITLIGIKSNIRRYKEKGYNTKNLGDLIDQIIQGGPVKSKVPLRMDTINENGISIEKEPVNKESEIRLEEEEMDNPKVVTLEMQRFLAENSEINLGDTTIVLTGERYERPSDLNEILQKTEIKTISQKQIVLSNDDRIDINDNVLKTVYDYEQLLGVKEYPIMYLIIMVIEQNQLKNFISSMKNVIRDNKLNQKEKQIRAQQAETQRQMNEKDRIIDNLRKEGENLKKQDEGIISGLQQENTRLKNQINATVESGKLNEQQILAQMNQLKNIAQQKEFSVVLTAVKNELDMVLKMDINEIMQYLSIVGILNERIHYKSKFAEAELSLRDILQNQIWHDIFLNYTQLFSMLYNTPISPVVLLLKILRAENNPIRIERVRNQIESLLKERFTQPDNIGIFVQQNNKAKDIAMEEEQESEYMKQLRQFIKQHENEKNDIELTETIYDITDKDVNEVLEIVSKGGILVYQSEYGNIVYNNITDMIPNVLQNYNTLRDYFTLVLNHQMNPVLVFDATLAYSNKQGNLDALLNIIKERIQANKRGEKMSMGGNTYNVNLAQKEVFDITNEVIRVLQEGGIQIINFHPRAYFAYNGKAIFMQKVMSEEEYKNMMKFLQEQMHLGEVALHIVILSYIYDSSHKKFESVQVGYDTFIKYIKRLIEGSNITVKEIEEEREKARGEDDEAMNEDLKNIDDDEDSDVEEEEVEEEPKREGGMKPIMGFTKNSYGGN